MVDRAPLDKLFYAYYTGVETEVYRLKKMPKINKQASRRARNKV